MYGHVLCYISVSDGHMFLCGMYHVLRLAWTSVCVWTNLCYDIYLYCLYIRMVCGIFVLLSVSFIIQPSTTCYWRLEVKWMDGGKPFVHTPLLFCILCMH